MPLFSIAACRLQALFRPGRHLALIGVVAGLLLPQLGLAQNPAPAPGQPQLDLPRAELSVGMHRIDAQIARTHEQRQIGLMHRRQMPAHEGMLFVFEDDGVQCFWMRNTLIPLTAAFIDTSGRIVNLADMQPLDESSHCSSAPVRYVLEMNQGWFAQRHIQAGHQVRGAVFQSP